MTDYTVTAYKDQNEKRHTYLNSLFKFIYLTSVTIVSSDHMILKRKEKVIHKNKRKSAVYTHIGDRRVPLKNLILK